MVEGLWGKVTVCRSHPLIPATWRVLVCLSPSLANWKTGAHIFPRMHLYMRKYFTQYYTTSLPCLLEGTEGDWHAPGAFLGTARGPRPRTSLAEGRCKGEDCHDPLHVSFSALEAVRIPGVQMDCPCPVGLISGPWSPFLKPERPAASVHLRRLWLHGQALPCGGPTRAWPRAHRLWLPDGLDVTCVFRPFKEPRCCKE